MRPSVGERERVARRLRGACDDERLSLDTFAARLEVVYAARHEAELGALVADLPEPHRLSRIALAVTAWASEWTGRLAEAWSRPRTPRLALPTRESVLLGRSRGCDCVLADETVSRRHALLTYRGGVWRLRDLASMNGTYVNHARVIDETEVRPGDDVLFGRTRFHLAPPAGSTQRRLGRLTHRSVA